jgi:FG-GAP-like repeat
MNRNIKLITTAVFLIATILLIQDNTIAQQYLLNEVEIDPPSTISNSCQYAEIRVVNPNGAVPANTYFLSVNSDGANFGFANQAINFGGQAVGSNGTITLFNNATNACPNRIYGPGTTFFSYSSPLTIGVGSETYLVVRSTASLFSGQDLDTDDDGVFDTALGITVLDGFGLIVNPKEEYVYGATAGVVNISNTISLDQPDAVTRFPNNNTPFLIGGFYFGELAASPDETTQYVAPLSPNFPSGGELTPGSPNFPSASVPTKAVVDFNGDGRTDYAVTRNVNGLLNWFTSINGSSETRFVQWGLQNDVAAPEDFDGDGKDDYAVWRSGNPSVASFYILQSSNNTVRQELFGQTGDNATLVGDWDGDGKADPAVYRAGSQSVFYYRGSLNNQNGNITFLPWGTTGDVSQRGDFDGDNKQDSAVFRPSNATWYILQSSNSQVRYDSFGLPTDKFVIADYDGDNKTDLAVFRNGIWYVKQSINNSVVIQNWGLGSDILVPGDYNGDGKSDFAIWRDGNFYVLPFSGGSQIIQNWGLNSDSPVANNYTR